MSTKVETAWLSKNRGQRYGGQRKPITYEVDSNGCWNCTSHYINKLGYPQTKVNGKISSLSRALYEEVFGLIPHGLLVRHLCNNPACINLDHLKIGTPADNNADMVAAGRQADGEKNGNHKLTTRVAMAIKYDYPGLSCRKLAKMFNTDFTNVALIRSGKTWKRI